MMSTLNVPYNSEGRLSAVFIRFSHFFSFLLFTVSESVCVRKSGCVRSACVRSSLSSSLSLSVSVPRGSAFWRNAEYSRSEQRGLMVSLLYPRFHHLRATLLPPVEPRNKGEFPPNPPTFAESYRSEFPTPSLCFSLPLSLSFSFSPALSFSRALFLVLSTASFLLNFFSFTSLLL